MFENLLICASHRCDTSIKKVQVVKLRKILNMCLILGKKERMCKRKKKRKKRRRKKEKMCERL